MDSLISALDVVPMRQVAEVTDCVSHGYGPPGLEVRFHVH